MVNLKNADNPLCTVVVPTLNPPGGFIRHMHKLVARHAGLVEWIVVNDGSDERYAQIWQHLPPACRVVHHDSNKGLAAARNSGFALAKTELLLPLDDDDWAEPGLVIAASRLLTDENPTAAFAYSWVVLKGMEKGVLVTPEWDTAEMLRRNLCCSCSVIRRNVFEELGGYDESFRQGLEDWEFWLRCIQAGYNGIVVKAPLVTYVRKRDSMLSRMQQDNVYWSQRERLLNKYAELYRQLVPDWSLAVEQARYRPPRGLWWQCIRWLRTLHLRFFAGKTI